MEPLASVTASLARAAKFASCSTIQLLIMAHVGVGSHALCDRVCIREGGVNENLPLSNK
jgi:hypothetical protein